MSCVTRVPFATESERSAGRRPFRRSATKVEPATMDRQAKLTLLAFQVHDERDEALAFLNGHCAELDGRPLDVAGGSDAGLVAASTLLAARRP